MRVVVLHDKVLPGAPPDSVNNLAQAKLVSDALTALGHVPRPLAFGERIWVCRQALTKLRPEVVFNLVEEPLGLARLIHLVPSLLERLRLPFTGSGSQAMIQTSNKLVAKQMLARAGLPTPDWVQPATTASTAKLEGAYILKSVWEHGSFGLDDDSVYRGGDLNQLRQAMAAKKARHGGKWFAERYIKGREFNLSLLAEARRPIALPPAEILFTGYTGSRLPIVGYLAKWITDSYEYKNTPRRFDFAESDSGLLSALRELSLQCWDLFGLRGWARVDFRVDLAGKPWVLEVNANPCLAADAGFLAAAARAGLKPKEVVERILADSKRGDEMPRVEKTVSK